MRVYFPLLEYSCLINILTYLYTDVFISNDFSLHLIYRDASNLLIRDIRDTEINDTVHNGYSDNGYSDILDIVIILPL